MEFIYPISYLLSLAGLVGWFFVQGNKKLSGPASALFLGGFLVYLLALSMASADLSYKFLILFRDLVVLAVVSQLFNIFQANKIVSIILAIGAILTVYLSYFAVLSNSFPQLNSETLAEDAEFLVHTGDLSQDDIKDFETRFECAFELAFEVANEDVTDLENYYVVNVLDNSARSRKTVYGALERSNSIEWVEPNEVLSIDIPVVDDVTGVAEASSSFLNDPGIKRQWDFSPIGANKLHKALTSSGVVPQQVTKIAIVDSGVDGNHEDLRANYVSADPKSDKDANGHGTHCAGVAAAVSNNRVGIASLAPATGYVTVTGYKVMNSFGFGTQQQVIKGILQAVDDGADVISLSLGAPTQRKKERIYQEAIDYAREHGAIVVVAAGNDGGNASNLTPANVEGVITVAATDQAGGKSHFSSTVQDLKMAVAAPGVNIYSTYLNNGYKALSGTSMAAPRVAGLVGLMKSLRPDLTTEDAFHIMQRTGTKTKDGALTGVLIQPDAAIHELMD